MQFPLTVALRDEIESFQLRSACPDCFFFVARDGRCAHEWPNEDQRRRPIEAPDGNGDGPLENLHLCKEFELR